MLILRYKEDIHYVSLGNYCFHKFIYKEVIAPLINLAIQCVAVHASGGMNVRILSMFKFYQHLNVFLTIRISFYYESMYNIKSR